MIPRFRLQNIQASVNRADSGGARRHVF